MKIDLHSHSNKSDGEHAPAELVRMAAAAGVGTLALTDHDTVAGVAEAMSAALTAGVELVPGIEISAELGGREVHVLGHFVDPASPALGDFARRMMDERVQRMERMIERLGAAGYPVSFDEVRAQSGGGAIGRPHLAHVIIARGWAKDFDEVFKRFLSRGGVAYVARERLDAADAVRIIVDAGGAATVAHPGVNRLTPGEIGWMQEAGLVGIEADHPDHPPSQVEYFQRTARNLGMVATAGSDFHGARVNDARRLGERTMDAEALERLRAARGKLPPEPAKGPRWKIQP